MLIVEGEKAKFCIFAVIVFRVGGIGCFSSSIGVSWKLSEYVVVEGVSED